MHPSQRQDITQRNVEGIFQSKAFQDTVAQRLAGGVRIPTVVYDSMGHVGTDPRWEVFSQFSEYLKETFPRV